MSVPSAPPRALVWDCAALRWEPAPPDPPTGDWIRCADLIAPGAAELDRHLALVAERQRVTLASVTASLLLERHASALATAAFGSLLGEGTLPDLSAANVAVRLDGDGFADALLLGDPCLEPVSPAAALEPLARGLLAAHLLPLVERLAERPVHRGRRALRCLVVDALAAGIAGAAGDAGTPPAEAAALAVALAAILGTPPPLHPRLLAPLRRSGAQARRLLPPPHGARRPLRQLTPATPRPRGGGRPRRAVEEWGP